MSFVNYLVLGSSLPGVHRISVSDPVGLLLESIHRKESFECRFSNIVAYRADIPMLNGRIPGEFTKELLRERCTADTWMPNCVPLAKYFEGDFSPIDHDKIQLLIKVPASDQFQPRIGKRAVSPLDGYSNETKRPRQLPSSELTTKFKGTTELAVEKLDKQLHELSVDAVKLSQPGFSCRLPFPYIGAVPERFHLDQGSQFEYFGRHRFAELYKIAKQMNPRQGKRVHLYGTLGSGKSHLLAALVCMLRKEGLRVVYLPDCYELLISNPPGWYVLKALYATFRHDVDLGHYVFALNQERLSGDPTRLEQKILAFCNIAADLGKPIIFIVDQANALDDSTEGHDRVSNDKKSSVRALLDGMSAEHMKISSSTANYLVAKHDQFRATSETRMTLDGGLDDEEMNAWWKHYETELEIQQEPDRRLSLERISGRLPLLLQALTEVTKKHEFVTVQQLFQRMMGTLEVTKMVGAMNNFVTVSFAKLKALDDQAAIASFRRGWQNCIFEQPMDTNDAMYLDGRFFYQDNNGVGRTTSDLARMVGASRLRMIENLVEYFGVRWFERIAHSGGNPAVLGFLVERVALGCLIQQGTIFAGPEFSKSLHPEKFSGILPESAPHKNDMPVIYIPTSYAYEAVDAILAIRLQNEKEKRDIKSIIIGVQVTIASSYSNSEETFMRSWKGWDELMGSKESEFRFVWIVEDMKDRSSDWVTVPEEIIKLRSKRIVVHPGYKRRYMSIMSLDNDLGNSLQMARDNS
ncbi:hypothetical protein DFH27DRAFT_654987 [Peziza echinospora]|nr:hypothetical protein DFH27DRAFT_654987 [Peziza echinospora]